MKRLFPAAVLMVAPIALGTCVASEAPHATAATAIALDVRQAEAEVRAVIERYNGHYGANELDAYFAAFAPSLSQWWPSGRVDLATYEKDWRKEVAEGGGVAQAIVRDLRVQIGPSSDAAVATYLLEVTPRKGGKPADAIELNQETDVLFKRGGQWKVVHVNYAPAAKQTGQ